MRVAFLVSVALIAAPFAYAQSANHRATNPTAQQVVNEQYQLRGTTSVTTVRVGEAHDVGASAIAGSNAVVASADRARADLSNAQHMDGNASATADVVAWNSAGVVTVASAAVANGATATAQGGEISVSSNQLAHGDSSAATRLTSGTSAHASSSAAASGNVAALSAENADIRAVANQESTGRTSATSEADHCCVGGQAVSAAIASANNISAAGYTTTLLTDTAQTATGASVTARSDLYAGYAYDASGNATANANALTIDNAFGYVNARASQTATAEVSAQSYVTLGGDFLGFASAGAYGVGNQAIVSNVTSDTVLDVTQANSGDISADAALVGGGGDMALASSAAYGNVVTGSLCAYCGDEEPTLNARNDQTNEGAVNANATVMSSRARTVAATSSAIGNAATYQVQGAN
ncbi:phage tail fiber protein [alpha proteobacterium U9-1i]|nr:phage tail fiber protein [alpha proteobacterium U9-1i]